MSKNEYQNIEELDPDSLEGVSELQKKHYKSLGYKPYRLQDGRIKWLTESQLVYKTAVRRHRLDFKVIRSKKPRMRRKHKKFLSFIRNNWLILVLIAVSVIAIIVVLIR
ncbi:MAG: hypothetical protein R6T89_01865 [Candidatus Syntrophosphaera sp.]